MSASVVGFRAELECSRSVPYGAYNATGVNSILTIDVFCSGIAHERRRICRKEFR